MGYRDREGRCWVATGRRYFDYLRLREANSELLTYVHKTELQSWKMTDPSSSASRGRRRANNGS